jgi:hypothetical protein
VALSQSERDEALSFASARFVRAHRRRLQVPGSSVKRPTRCGLLSRISRAGSAARYRHPKLSAAGKSSLMEAILAMTPKEEQVEYSVTRGSRSSIWKRAVLAQGVGHRGRGGASRATTH